MTHFKSDKDIGVFTRATTVEISKVDEAANRRKFLVLKNKGSMMDEILKNVLDVEVEGEDVISKSADLSEKQKGALVALMRIASSYRDELSSESVADTLKAAGIELPQAEPVVEQAEETPAQEEEVDVAKAADLPEEVQEVFKALQDKVEKQEQELLAQKAAHDKAQEKLLRAEYTAKAKEEFGYLGGYEQVGLALKGLAEHKELFAAWEPILKAANEKIEKGNFFTESTRPSDGEGEVQKSAYDKLNERAQELLVTKKAKSMSQALVMAASENRELAEEAREG